MIEIKAFRAINNTEACQKYIDGHRKILEIYGVTKVTSANTDWASDPASFVIMVESASTGKILGGARIQVAQGSLPLPIEEAVGEMDSSIYNIIKEYGKGATGELCGLWNSREVAGMGIGSIFLGRVGVAITTQLNLNSVFALCSPATLANCKRVGFIIEKSLGNNGTFYYPKEDLLATALVIPNPVTIENAELLERESILNLRQKPRQRKTEIGPKGEIEVEYDLIIS